MNTYTIALEERICTTYTVEADSIEQALEDIRESYLQATLQLSDYPEVHGISLQAVDNSTGEYSEWEEINF